MVYRYTFTKEKCVVSDPADDDSGREGVDELLGEKGEERLNDEEWEIAREYVAHFEGSEDYELARDYFSGCAPHR